MRILFLCTAYNSLSQRLYLVLSKSHDVTIEYALSDEVMISAVALSAPDLVICPFLTTLVPKCIYEKYMTLIIHPGPPGDAGPSALDWVLMGDDGSIDDPQEVLRALNAPDTKPGRSHWGVTVLQAIEEFDAGPVWGFEQFALDIDQGDLTKSELYRGPITQAAVIATLAAISRIQAAATASTVAPNPNESTTRPYLDAQSISDSTGSLQITPSLSAHTSYASLSITTNLRFQGGRLHHRPLLKAAQRDFDFLRHSAQQISRHIRCGDSQPGVLSTCFGGEKVYVYGGRIEDNVEHRAPFEVGRMKAKVLGIRNGALCLATLEGKGIWITHIRRMKLKADKALWPKVPTTAGLLGLGLISPEDVKAYNWPSSADWKMPSFSTFQEVSVDFQLDEMARKTAYVYFNFYNGAMATEQCSHLIEALDYVLAQSTPGSPVQAVVMMGGAYFSNGIALNVIEAASDPAMESWNNINRIDDVVHYLLYEFPAKNILTFAAIRGNAAAGGVALATACDVVVAGSEVVLNPAYRAVGLFGSEYHTISYYGRCGEDNAKKILRSMKPMSVLQAQSIGLVDYVFSGRGKVLEDYIRSHVAYLLKPGCLKRGLWKKNINDTSPSELARARAYELGEMSLDFWSARSARYHSRRFDFVRKIKATQTPLRFAVHRRTSDPDRLDEEETEDFDSVTYYQKMSEDRLIAGLRKELADEVKQVIVEQEKKVPKPEVVVQELPVVPIVPVERKTEPVFSCYYKLDTEDLLTPPESPLGHGEVVLTVAS